MSLRELNTTVVCFEAELCYQWDKRLDRFSFLADVFEEAGEMILQKSFLAAEYQYSHWHKWNESEPGKH